LKGKNRKVKSVIPRKNKFVNKKGDTTITKLPKVKAKKNLTPKKG
jgi:hypothetical protein